MTASHVLNVLLEKSTVRFEFYTSHLSGLMTLALINLPFSDCPHWMLVILLLVGFAALNYGGDRLTDGAVVIANAFHVNKVVIGLTIVSMATSMPEMMTSLLAAKASPGLAVGNILGSNIANIGLILGITALIVPLTVGQRLIRLEMPMLVAISGLFIVFAIGGYARWEGFVMLTIMLTYLYFVVRWAKKDSARAREAKSLLPDDLDETKPRSSMVGALYILLGSSLLALGADILVGTSVEIASRLGISDVLIGLTIVAIGTSLPELAASIAAARSGHQDICVGNIVGSNLFNILLIGGSVASLVPIPVDPELFRIEFPAMMIILLIFLWMAKKRPQISRGEGVFLLLLYFTILTVSSIFQLKF